MSTPIIIPARNEATHIARTLDALATQSENIEPIVIVNGSTDGTAEIADTLGVTVLESAPGKMRAIQTGLRFLGDNALSPLIILDADTKPASKRWATTMTSSLAELPKDAPAIAWGPYAFTKDINPIVGAIITATSAQVSWSDRNLAAPRTIRGGNTALRIENEETLDSLFGLKNYWPREDVAIFDTIMEHKGSSKVLFQPSAWVLTSGQRTRDTIHRIIKDHKHPSKVMDDSYASEAPADSEPYFSATTNTVPHDQPE